MSTSLRVIQEVSRLVNSMTGVQLGENQTSMVEFRLRKRVNDLGLRDLDAYLDYLKANVSEESKALVALLTTHHTFFFREFAPFEFLQKEALSKLVDAARAACRKCIRAWSAACSRGQEVYSLAMFLDVHLKQIAPDFSFEVWGSDVDANSVEVAKNGVYLWDDLKSSPALYLSNHWVRGTDDIKAYVKCRNTLRAKCQFRTANLLDVPANLKSEKFDIVWCRNVLIYFNQDQIKKVVASLASQLYPSGILTLGLSEGMNGVRDELDAVGPTTYSRKGAWKSVSSEAYSKVESAVKPQQDRLLRVLCVDDSSSIITVMKKILSKEAGFEVVGSAANGLEAAKFLKSNTVDLVTLDIHMPEQNGIEYLQANFGPKHPPVVVVSSVAREDKILGLRALELGATDFIEKPSIQDIKDRGDEIRAKLKAAASNPAVLSDSSRLGLDREMSGAKTSHEEMKLPTSTSRRFVILSPAERLSLRTLLREMKATQPQAPLFVLVHNHRERLDDVRKQIENEGWSAPIEAKSLPAESLPNQIYLTDGDWLRRLILNESRKTSSIMVLGKCPDFVPKALDGLNCHLILEDLGNQGSDLPEAFKKTVSWIIPRTSFVYHSDRFLKTGK